MGKTTYLGWGFTGSPKGRQQIGTGVTSQLNSAEHYDLDQQMGGILPDPRQKNYVPLYCLKFRKIGQHNVLGLAEYLSIYEQGQTRAGTFFGAFVEVVDHAFSPEMAKYLINQGGDEGALWQLNLHQFDHFIDKNTVSYHTGLKDKSIPPLPFFKDIANGLRPLNRHYLTQTPTSDDLFVSCTEKQAADVFALLLENQLYYQYKNIYFSGNTHINEKIRTHRITKISFAQLQSRRFFTQPYEKEIIYLYSVISQTQQREREVTTQFQQLKAHQDKYVDEQVKQKSASYIEQAEGYKKMAVQAQKQTQDAQLLAELGESLIRAVGQKADQLGKADLSRFAPVQQPNKTEQMLINIDSSIKKLSMDLANSHSVQQVEVEKEVVKKSPWTVIWAGFSGLLFMILLGILITSLLSSDESVTKEEHNKLKDEKIKLEADLQSEKTTSQKTIENLNQHIKQLQQEKDNLQSELSKPKSTRGK